MLVAASFSRFNSSSMPEKMSGETTTTSMSSTQTLTLSHTTICASSFLIRTFVVATIKPYGCGRSFALFILCLVHLIGHKYCRCDVSVCAPRVWFWSIDWIDCQTHIFVSFLFRLSVGHFGGMWKQNSLLDVFFARLFVFVLSFEFKRVRSSTSQMKFSNYMLDVLCVKLRSEIKIHSRQRVQIRAAEGDGSHFVLNLSPLHFLFLLYVHIKFNLFGLSFAHLLLTKAVWLLLFAIKYIVCVASFISTHFQI